MSLDIENLPIAVAEYPAKSGDPQTVKYRKGNVVLFGLFLFYVLYWYLQVGYRVKFLGEIRFEFILGAFLTIVAGWSYLPYQGKAKTTLYAWAGLLILLMALMTLLSQDPITSYDVFVDRVLKFAMMALFIVAFVNSPNRLRWFIAIWLLAFMKMGQEGMYGILTGGTVWQNQEIPRLHGASPIYADPNSFSGTQLGTLPFVVFFFPLVSWPYKLLLALQALFASSVVLYTGSRTGYLGFAVAVLLFLLLPRSRKKAVALVLALGLCLAPFIPADYVDRAQTIFVHNEGGPGVSSIDLREQIMRDAWAIFLDNPLGVGVRAFPLVRTERFGRTQDTHNLYLEVLTNLGIQGFILFMGLIVALLRTLARLRRSFDDQLERLKHILEENAYPTHIAPHAQRHLSDLSVMRATSLSVFVFIIIRLTVGFFGMDLYEIYWWFALGLTMALLNMNKIAAERTNWLLAQPYLRASATAKSTHLA